VARTVYQKFEALLAAVFMAIFLLWIFGDVVKKNPLPEFSTYENVKEKKQKFIEYFSAEFERLNNIIEFRRQRLLLLYGEYYSGEYLEEMDRDFILHLADKYRIKEFDFEKRDNWMELSRRVDIVPVAVGVAQGAIESAWGTSRFAREGNNFFGVWCFTEGCGIVPRSRSKRLKHEVRSYKNVVESVTHYMHTLNTNNAYKLFREMRHQQRLHQGHLSGYKLATALKNYSGIGNKYVKLVQQVIKGNNLE
jgi:Bax protein